MSDQDLIDKMAELWDREGGDVKGFWFCVRRIAEAIDEIQDTTKHADYIDTLNPRDL